MPVQRSRTEWITELNKRAEQRARVSARMLVQANSENNGRWKGDDAGKVAVHHWVKKRKQKTGRCSECGEERYTEWSNVDHKYKRNLDDYIELCKPCHIAYDRKLRARGDRTSRTAGRTR